MSTKVETEGPTRVGSRAVDTRRIPGGPRDFRYEVVEHDPPRTTSFQGTDGPCGRWAPLSSSRSTTARARA